MTADNFESTYNEPALSVVLPCYNVGGKLDACLVSLDDLHSRLNDCEVIFVDDLSTDGTYEALGEFGKSRPWVHLFQLSENSGSPSKPRNEGLKRARGEFVFFLDPDDEVLPDGVLASLEKARKTGADLVRAPLVRFDGATSRVMNQIENWDEIREASDRLREFVKVMSTTPPTVYRRSHLVSHQVSWPEDLNLAEDAVFLYSAIEGAKIEYSPIPDYVYHAEENHGGASLTQQYQEREMRNHTQAWTRAETILRRMGIDFFEVRGQMALQAALQNMIKFNRGGFPQDVFDQFSAMLRKHKSVVKNYSYSERFASMRDALLAGDKEAFEQQIKLRLLIAGYDLRFVLPATEHLEEHFSVRVDEWDGHEKHDVERSRKLLDWADVIHCEWMLGNAVWYSQNKHEWQTLVVRLHRFENDRPYGRRLEPENVDRFITIAPAMLEEMQRNFEFPREKVCYVPNYVESELYLKSDDSNKVFNLAMVGSIPIRKGYRRALELLKMLHQIDDRYNLAVFGKAPTDLGWVIKDPEERRYFDACTEFVRNNGLENAVRFEGWVDTKTALADKGFVLSMSDAEGSHVAAAEGFASGNITILRPWEGAEYMYPEEYIMDDLLEMRDYILECRDYSTFKLHSAKGFDYVKKAYSMERFLSLYVDAIPAPKRVSY